VPDWPRTFLPLDDDGQADDRQPVELFQHRPDTTDDLAAWCDGQTILVNGGPVVLLPGTRADRQIVGLGDYALRTDGGRYRVEYADGLATRYTPAQGGDGD
jgi:hypothetical protein